MKEGKPGAWPKMALLTLEAKAPVWKGEEEEQFPKAPKGVSKDI